MIRRVDTAKGHRYEDDAGRVPGVTTILGDGCPKPALINWAANTTADYAINHWDDLTGQLPAARLKTLQGARYAEKDAAASKGTAVHKFAEDLVQGRSVQVPDPLVGHVEAYARFLEEFDVHPIAVEFMVFSEKYRYAGTADLCATITHPEYGRVQALLDVKTNRSGIFGETAWQIAAYRYAETWVVDGNQQLPPELVLFTGAVHVRSDGYSLIPVTAERPQFLQFLYIAEVAKAVNASRDLVGDAITPPTTSTYRIVRDQ